jgi:transposase
LGEVRCRHPHRVSREAARVGSPTEGRNDRGSNRQLNAAIYRIAITQARYHAPARDYLERKRAEGKRMRSTRCLKRRLVRVIFNTLKASPALT